MGHAQGNDGGTRSGISWLAARWHSWRQKQAKREHAWSKVRLHEGKKQGSGESGVRFGDAAARR
jgi:hypothetical protein